MSHIILNKWKELSFMKPGSEKAQWLSSVPLENGVKTTWNLVIYWLVDGDEYVFPMMSWYSTN